jgi:hypothetical protein
MTTKDDRAALLAKISSAAAGVKLNNKEDIILKAKKAMQ